MFCNKIFYVAKLSFWEFLSNLRNFILLTTSNFVPNFLSNSSLRQTKSTKTLRINMYKVHLFAGQAWSCHPTGLSPQKRKKEGTPNSQENRRKIIKETILWSYTHTFLHENETMNLRTSRNTKIFIAMNIFSLYERLRSFLGIPQPAWSSIYLKSMYLPW